MIKVNAIFDIGKTNKKFILFNDKFHQLHKSYQLFEEVFDEDNHPCDDLVAISKWILKTVKAFIQSDKYQLESINFSTYGATLVHMNHAGQPITPLYNYTKAFPEDLMAQFLTSYGPKEDFERKTASPLSGFLNSGLQLYWLKYRHPEIFNQIRYSLHFPQYLSYLLTGIPLSDYTSIGCHTGLWDFEKKDYHDWVYAENIHRILPPIVAPETSINYQLDGKNIKIGTGIHDSSAALIPYIKNETAPFTLISTGTWSIALNPFNTEPLSKEDLKLDQLNYMKTDGQQVRASRLFLGNEYELQVQKLFEHFDKPYGYEQKVSFDKALYTKLKSNFKPCYHFEGIPNIHDVAQTDYGSFRNFVEAYYQLMLELTMLQVTSLNSVIGKTKVKKIFIDGGFSDNEFFVKILALEFPKIKIRTTLSPIGSALGAAMVISDKKLPNKFLKEHYQLQKI